MNPFAAAHAKSEMNHMIDAERAAAMASNGMIQDPSKKPKPKQNLRLNVPAKPEDGTKVLRDLNISNLIRCQEKHKMEKMLAKWLLDLAM